MRICFSSVLLLMGLLFAGDIKAQEKTRDELVLDDRARMLNNQDWVYDEFEEARTIAEKQGKPLMVVLRCIP